MKERIIKMRPNSKGRKPGNSESKLLQEAAAAGEREVQFEKRGNLLAAERAGTTEKRLQVEASQRRPKSGPSRPSTNGKSGNGGVSGRLDNLTQIGRVEVPAAPPPDLFTMPTGRVVATDIIRDRIMTAGIQVFMINATPDWGSLKTTTTVALQTGLTGNQYGALNRVVGIGILNNLYNMIARQYQAKLGRVIRDTVLDDGGTNDSIIDWLNNYCRSFLMLRALQGILEAGNFNYTLQLASSAVNQNLPRLVANLRRMMSFSVPPMLIEYLERLSGVKALDRNSPVYVAGLANGNQMTDITTSAGIVAYLTAVEGYLGNLATGVTPATQFADFQRISNLFALAYGENKFAYSKLISYDPGEYFMQCTQAITFLDTAATATTQLTTFPNLTVAQPATNMIPMLIPIDIEGSEGQYLTLLRTPVCSNDPVTGANETAGQANQIGLLDNVDISAGLGTVYGYYEQNATLTTPATGFSNAGTSVLNYATPELEMMVWGSEAAIRVANYLADTRSFQGLRKVYVPIDYMIDSTSYVIEKMFLEPIGAVS